MVKTCLLDDMSEAEWEYDYCHACGEYRLVVIYPDDDVCDEATFQLCVSCIASRDYVAVPSHNPPLELQDRSYYAQYSTSDFVELYSDEYEAYDWDTYDADDFTP
jgi:hypothetical protein